MQSVALGYTSVPTESLGILIMLFKAWLSVRYLVSILQTSDFSIVLFWRPLILYLKIFLHNFSGTLKKPAIWIPDKNLSVQFCIHKTKSWAE